MKLFISKGLWKYRNYQIKLEKVDNKRTKLIICNLQDVSNSEEEYKNIEFIIPKSSIDLKTTWNDYITSSSKLRKTAHGYTFDEAASDNSRVIYALLHYEKVVPSEIYIHDSMKSYVEVLENIKFYDVEPDYGEYLVNLYFVKITIPQNKTIPFYFSWKSDLKILENHLIFSNTPYYGLEVRNGKTYIILDSSETKNYIPLSKL